MRIMSTPRSIEIEITSKCNLRCKYCYHFSSEGDVDIELSTKEWLRFFKECNTLGIMNILLSGGEPFIRKDIKEIIIGIIDNRMRYSINSNGTLISQDVAIFLRDTRRCEYVQISIDGHCSEIHDSFRGKGSFIKAIDGLNNLRKNNVPVTVRLTIHQKNIKYLKEIAKFLFEDLELSGFSTNAAMYVGLMRKNVDEIQLNIDQYAEAMEVLSELNKKYDNRIDSMAGPLADAFYWPKMYNAHKKKLKPFSGCGILNSCGCAFNKIAVRADGVIVPCNQINGYELGKINDNCLKGIWNNSEKLNNYRNRFKIRLDNFNECKNCDYIDYCKGGCPATINNLRNSVFFPSTVDCFKTFLENGGKLPSRLEN